LHTPASADWLEPGVTYLEWLQKAESRGLDIVAITDHNTVEGVAKLRAEIERLTWLEANERLRPQEQRDLEEYRRLGDKILVLPGFEFTATFGFHIIGVFPPETPLRNLELLLLRLNVPVNRLEEGITEVGASTDVLTAYRLIHEAGGIVIAAHANSTHGVALQGLSFGGQTKIAFTQDPHLHALEVTDLESSSRRATARFFDGSKPEYPRRMHCIQGSDAHRLVRDPKDKNRAGIGDRVTEVLLRDTTFEDLKAVFEADDFTRTRPYQPLAEVPFDFVEAAREQGNTIIQSFQENMTRDGGRLHKVLCDVVAFANTRGGTVYVGVSATRKNAPRGIENPEGAVAYLKRELERNIVPQLDAKVDIVQSLGASIVRVTVPSGPDRPYAVNQTQIFVRQEGETSEAVRDEIVQLVLGGRQAAAIAEVEQTLGPVSAEAREPVIAETEAPPPAYLAADLPLPSIGVEIIAVEERLGARYFTIRDLRNGSTVQNVTAASARKLWSYAITQHLTHPVDPAAVTWRGEFGLWKAERRAKKLRYDLALRQADAPGGLRVFYGVTEDGMTGPWAQFLKAEVEVKAEVEGEDDGEDEAEGEVAVKPKASSRRRRSRGGGKREAKVEVAAEAEVEGKAELPVVVPAVVPAEARPRTSSRRRKPKAQAEVEAEVEVKAETEPQAQAEVVEALPAETKPETGSRGRKPKAQVEAEVQVETPAAVLAETKPTTSSRSRKPKAEAEAPAVQPVEPVAEVAQPTEIKPKPRTRSRKPKAQPETEA
jgi:hypothetical protein